MVRLEIETPSPCPPICPRFTFQYGQIRNFTNSREHKGSMGIYIPVWLDQKSKKQTGGDLQHYYLHSSMVRLEIQMIITCHGTITDIYIPVWLDQKYKYKHTLVA